jgi:hypothetical protein
MLRMELADTIRRVHAGEKRFPPEIGVPNPFLAGVPRTQLSLEPPARSRFPRPHGSRRSIDHRCARRARVSPSSPSARAFPTRRSPGRDPRRRPVPAARRFSVRKRSPALRAPRGRG